MLNDEFGPDKLRAALLKGGIGKDLKQREKQANQQRRWAEEERESKDDKKGSKPTFLRPSDIAGDYDFKRALQTTLGMPEGMTRKLTAEDLKAFAANVEQMQQAYKGGITVEQVISLSNQDDIDRANKQIYASIPTRRKGNMVHFTTNAGPGSDVNYHHVQVEFLAFNELVFNPDRVKATTVRNRLSRGRVKFECDCGRFNYWFRYLNTVAGTVYGRREGGFPKIRNPNMTGIACKHILRVMHWIKSQEGSQYLGRALEKERTRQVGAKYKTGKREIADTLAMQVVRANTKRSQITPKLQAEVAKLEAKAKKHAQNLLRKQKELETKHQAMAKLKALHEQGILSDAEYAVLSGKK
ncbi:hypothetical protein F965_00086 [Acinetobacter schindleri NIPH 900]|uniref:SWIM-type domain-containing protein n=1 Tax=Acinetobacter schindleri NIPH 900 TaxID=1217675 RepID=N8Y5Y4_9GAMM|nr:hypothetical protein [Acinetobacter schindleri]ENV14740.1 hypothetical protein F965_00086 [Acinetobacter schindleri NIPH 900]